MLVPCIELSGPQALCERNICLQITPFEHQRTPQDHFFYWPMPCFVLSVGSHTSPHYLIPSLHAGATCKLQSVG